MRVREILLKDSTDSTDGDTPGFPFGLGVTPQDPLSGLDPIELPYFTFLTTRIEPPGCAAFVTFDVFYHLYYLPSFKDS